MSSTLSDLLKDEKHFHKTFHFTDDLDITELNCSSSDSSICSETDELHTCSDSKCLNVKIAEVLDPNYGLYVWPCAPFLAQYIWDNRECINGKTVFELGAGTALPSIVAAKCGAARVIATDSRQFKYVLELAEHNLQLNNISQDKYKVDTLTWGNFTPFLIGKQRIDLLLGSDVLYDNSDRCEYESLLVTVSFILKRNPKAEFWCAYENRSSDWNVSHLLNRWNLQIKEVPLDYFEGKFNVVGSDLRGLRTVTLYIITLRSKEVT